MIWSYAGDPASRIEVDPEEIQSARFMGEYVFVVYVEGDADQFLPFVRLA